VCGLRGDGLLNVVKLHEEDPPALAVFGGLEKIDQSLEARAACQTGRYIPQRDLQQRVDNDLTGR
jgi:hypothetical protein